MKADDLERVCVELLEVKRAAWNMQATVYGSDEVKGGNVVWCGLARGEFNGMSGTVVAWDGERERWAVQVGGESMLVKEEKIFAAGGLAPKSAVIEHKIL